MIRLLDAVDLGENPCAAIVGAGGKTSLLFRLARAMDRPALISNSAHLAVEQSRLADITYTATLPEDLPDFTGQSLHGVTLVTGPVDERGRCRGLDPAELERLFHQARRLGAPFLIEADGSRRLPLKAPDEHEPPIPEFVDGVIVVAGLSGLGKPLSEDWVFRPEVFARLAGMAQGEPITVDHLARVLCHPAGGLKNIPAGARRRLLLNQADTLFLQEQAESVARQVGKSFAAVAVASLHGMAGEEPVIHAVYHRVAGIVLAAGGSVRMGRPKQLLEWQGEPLVRRAVRVAIDSGLDPVILVCGAAASEVSEAVSGLPVEVVINHDWKEGQSTSLRAGLKSLPREIGAAAFFLVDQPYVSAELVQSMLKRYQRTLAPVVAPLVKGRRGNPVLFNRKTFPDLMALEGDTGGRKVIERWPLETVDWADDRIFLDVDTLEDYRALKPGYSYPIPPNPPSQKGLKEPEI